MPSLDDRNENTKTLSALYQQQREIKAELEQKKLNEKQARYKAIAESAQQEWKLVDELAHDMLHKSHGYGAGWTRLYDFAWTLNAALSKDSPMRRGQMMDNYIMPAVNTVSYYVGGFVGGLVGGVGGLFGVGDGVAAGAKSGVRFVTGTPNDEVQYFVDVNDEGTLDYWVKRTDGKELTKEEKTGFMADVHCWLGQQGYEKTDTPWVYTPDLTKESFAELRDHPVKGLANYFSNKLEVKQSCKADKIEAEKTDELWQSATMNM